MPTATPSPASSATNPHSDKYTLHVSGMHCASCELLIENKLKSIQGLENIHVSLSKQEVTFSAIEKPQLESLNESVNSHGYSLSWRKITSKKPSFKELALPFLIATTIFSIFILLQKLNLINLVNPENISLPFVFLIGIIASLSTCMAVVGGLVLTLSSGYSQAKQIKPIIRFHLARLIGFFVFGGGIGLIGSAFLLTPGLSFILNLILFFIMFIMGINLLGFFHFTAAIQFKLPKAWGRAITAIKQENRTITPIFLGLATFFLPCGFTQSMQVYALSSGDWLAGALIMLVFALGTFPMLGMISFVSTKIGSSANSKLFFQTSGFLVLFFAVINLSTAFSTIGLPFLSI